MSYDTARIRADNLLSAIIGKSVTLKANGQEFEGLCPFHKEKTPSFTVSDPKGFYHCFGCGAHGDVIRFVQDFHGASFQDACQMLGGQKELPTRIADASDGKETDRKVDKDIYKGMIPVYPLPEIKPGEPVTYWNPKRQHFTTSVPSMVFPYRNYAGDVRGYVLRIDIRDPETGKNNKLTPSIRYVKKENGELCLSMMPFEKPRHLYGLERLGNSNGQIVLVEGEKACDAAVRLGIDAYTWPGGGKGIAHVDWSPLIGKRVVLWGDADQPGQDTMLGYTRNGKSTPGIAEQLHAIGAESIRIIPWDKNRPEGWDAADAERDGMTLQQIIGWVRETACAWQARAATPEAAQPTPQEPKKPKNVVQSDPQNVFNADNTPFRCLGYDDRHYYYLSHRTNTIHALSAGQHTKSNLISLAALHYWEGNFPERSGFDLDAAINALMSTCSSRGFFDINKICGRGAWWDKGRIVVHLGDRLMCNDEEHSLSKFESRYIYRRGLTLDADLHNPLNNSRANKFNDLASMLSWERPIFSRFFAGWCVLAHIGGALEWRPHLWIIGRKGSGKSFSMSRIVRPILADNCLFVQSSSTEAGIRQSLGADSLPVLFDEAEGEDAAAVQRMQRVLQLIRQSSSDTGGIIAKGTTTGEAMRFNIRSCFCLSSINASIIQQADKSRITVIELSQEHHRHTLPELNAAVDDLLTQEYIASFHARAVKLAPVIRKNARKFAAAVADTFGEQRVGDQIGALLAGAYSLHSDREITLEKAKEWVQTQDWKEQKSEVQDQSDENSLLMHLMQHRIHAQFTRGSDHITVGELIELAAGATMNDNLSYQQANQILGRYGFKVDGKQLLISNSATAIREILKNTPWSAEWARVLRRLAGATTPENPIYFASKQAMARAVAIPVDLPEYIPQRPPLAAYDPDDLPF